MQRLTQCLIWMLIFGLLAYWASIFVEVYFPQKNHINVSDVSLGVLCPDDNVEFSVTIYNHGHREIALDSLQYHLEQEDAGRYAFSVSSNIELSNEVQEKGKITGSLLIEFEEADQEPLEFPIDLVSRPKFTVLPARLELSRGSLSEKHRCRKLQ